MPEGFEKMIRLTRLNHAVLVVNCDLIEHIEMTPDTVISMTSGQRITVLETSDEVIGRVIEYRRLLLRAPEVTAGETRNGNLAAHGKRQRQETRLCDLCGASARAGWHFRRPGAGKRTDTGCIAGYGASYRFRWNAGCSPGQHAGDHAHPGLQAQFRYVFRGAKG